MEILDRARARARARNRNIIHYPGLFMKRKDCWASWALFEIAMNNAGYVFSITITSTSTITIFSLPGYLPH